MTPISPAILVSNENIIELSKDQLNPKNIGEKAFGLCCLPKQWTLPFFVISGELLQQFINSSGKKQKKNLDAWIAKIKEAASLTNIGNGDPIIVRSSGYSEGMSERGMYYSYKGKMNNVREPLLTCLEKLSLDSTLQRDEYPLVIQKLSDPINAKGHLSNERRFYEEKRDWIGGYDEIRGVSNSSNFKINIRPWRKKIDANVFINNALSCSIVAHIKRTLEIAATWAYNHNSRIHFEWVWDGETIYLVQADQEKPSNGLDPSKVSTSLMKLSRNFTPKCLKLISENYDGKFNKIKNVLIYKKLKFPTTPLYILDDQIVIKNLATGSIPSDLVHDIKELVKASLVIRMDIESNEIKKRQLLPRTNEVRNFEDAFNFLKNQSSMINQENDIEFLAFIFHNYIPATSSAFAYAAPGERKVQIEALWGLPEGLYYNSHDKYIIDTMSSQADKLVDVNIDNFIVKAKRNFKNFFVIPDEEGHWKTKVLKAPYDWRGSIQHNKWAKKIALKSRQIAEEENKPVSIMWFIGTSREICPDMVFPWYHEPYDPTILNPILKKRTKKTFEKSLVIKTRKDIELLKSEAVKEHSQVRRISIQPEEDELLRDKNTLRDIGELSKKINSIIMLDGGVLSHAYYQLMKTKAIVEVENPFDDLQEKRVFYKIVRDKIPQNIESGGEIVMAKKLSGDELIRLLKEKLVEESIEVLDSIDQDSILAELADVNEVIDGILFQLGLNRSDLEKGQDEKREKAGGFIDGVVLLGTKNPLPSKEDIKSEPLFNNSSIKDTPTLHPYEIIELSHKVEKWTDNRKHTDHSEVILKMEVPIVIDSWDETSPEIEIGSELPVNTIKAKIIGSRVGSKMDIRLSLFTPHQQLHLFGSQ